MMKVREKLKHFFEDVAVMPRLSTTSSTSPRTKNKNRAQIGSKVAPSDNVKITRPGKRDRRKRKAVKGPIHDVIDLTNDHEGEHDVQRSQTAPDTIVLSAASRLASQEAGPSRIRSEPASTDKAIATNYIPTAFTPVARSVLTGLASHSMSHLDSPPEPHLANDTHTAGAKIIVPNRNQYSPGPIDRPSSAPPPNPSSGYSEDPFSSSIAITPTLDPVIGSLQIQPQKSDENEAAEAEEQDTLLLPSHVLLDRPASVVKAKIKPSGEDLDSRADDSLMEGLYFVDDDVSKVRSSLFDRLGLTGNFSL